LREKEMKSPVAVECDLFAGLTEAIQSLPGVACSLERGGGLPPFLDGPDIVLLAVGTEERRARVVVEVKRPAYPRDIREMARELLAYASRQSHVPAVPMIAAYDISAGARELLRREGIGIKADPLWSSVIVIWFAYQLACAIWSPLHLPALPSVVQGHGSAWVPMID
jgi:hypothetical protein